MATIKVFSIPYLAQGMHELGCIISDEIQMKLAHTTNSTCQRKHILSNDSPRRHLDFSWGPLNLFSLGLILLSKDSYLLSTPHKLKLDTTLILLFPTILQLSDCGCNRLLLKCEGTETGRPNTHN